MSRHRGHKSNQHYSQREFPVQISVFCRYTFKLLTTFLKKLATQFLTRKTYIRLKKRAPLASDLEPHRHSRELRRYKINLADKTIHIQYHSHIYRCNIFAYYWSLSQVWKRKFCTQKTQFVFNSLMAPYWLLDYV